MSKEVQRSLSECHERAELSEDLARKPVSSGLVLDNSSKLATHPPLSDFYFLILEMRDISKFYKL